MIVSDIGIGAGLHRVGNAIRRIGVFHTRGLCRVQLRDRAVIFPAVMREAVMPEDVVLHEGNTLSLHGIGNHNGRLVPGVAGIRQCAAECVMVVSVQLDDVPAERAARYPSPARSRLGATARSRKTSTCSSG